MVVNEQKRPTLIWMQNDTAKWVGVGVFALVWDGSVAQLVFACADYVVAALVPRPAAPLPLLHHHHSTPPPSLHAARTCACPSPNALCRIPSLVVTITTTFIIIIIIFFFIMATTTSNNNNKSSSSSPLPPMLFSSRAHESALWPPNHHAVGHTTCDW